MPTYVYACRECDARVELVQKMSDAPLTTCNECGGSLRKVLFPPAVVYKGSGFYTTDYKKSGESGESSSGEKAAKGSTQAGDSSTKGSESAGAGDAGKSNGSSGSTSTSESGTSPKNSGSGEG